MIAFVHMYYEFEGQQLWFIDFEDFEDEMVEAILEIRNRYRGDDGPWSIEGRFSEGEADGLSHWSSFLAPEHFFTYLRWGCRVPRQEGDSRKIVRTDTKYMDIEPTDAFDILPLEILKRFAETFRADLENDEYEHLEDSSTTVFTPLFEQEVEKRS